MQRDLCLKILLAAVVVGFCYSPAQSQNKNSKPTVASKKPGPPVNIKLPIQAEAPFYRIDRKVGYVDLDAEVCLDDGFLELFATTKGGKEHEAAIAIRAKPSELHIALLALGVKQGKPGHSVKQADGTWKRFDPKGGKVRVTVIYEKDGKAIERPIQYFVHDPVAKKKLSDNVFLFAGSRFARDGNGKPYYMADGDPNVLSFVSFGNEVLTLPKFASKNNDELQWQANPKSMPKIGTKVVLRLLKIVEPKPAQKPKDSKATDAKKK